MASKRLRPIPERPKLGVEWKRDWGIDDHKEARLVNSNLVARMTSPKNFIGAS
jgi:hypothetical protein